MVLLILLLLLDIGRLQKADTFYKQGKFAEALELYREEAKEAPDNPRLAFNIGNSLMKLGKHDEAADMFRLAESLTRSADEASNASYNRALSNIAQQDMETAWKDARQAVKMNPSDPDARANFEIISRIINQQQQQQQQQQNQNKDDKEKQDQEKKQDQQQQNQDQNQDQNKDQKQQQQPQQASISKEQAQRLLDALKKNEQEALLKKKEMQARMRRQSEKDW